MMKCLGRIRSESELAITIEVFLEVELVSFDLLTSTNLYL